MKKIYILLSIMIMLLCSGCFLGIGGIPNMEPILEGTYVSYDEENTEVFSNAKFSIKEITKEEYEEANGENVFIDASTYLKDEDEKRYLFIELYLYSVETKQYELATLNDLDYRVGTGHCYSGKITLNINDNMYVEDDHASFAFEYCDRKELVHMTLFTGNKEFITFFKLQ